MWNAVSVSTSQLTTLTQAIRLRFRFISSSQFINKFYFLILLYHSNNRLNSPRRCRLSTMLFHFPPIVSFYFLLERIDELWICWMNLDETHAHVGVYACVQMWMCACNWMNECAYIWCVYICRPRYVVCMSVCDLRPMRVFLSLPLAHFSASNDIFHFINIYICARCV